MSYTIEAIKANGLQIEKKIDLIETYVKEYNDLDFVNEDDAKKYRRIISTQVADLCNLIKITRIHYLRSDENKDYVEKRAFILLKSDAQLNRSDLIANAEARISEAVLKEKEKYIEADANWKHLNIKIDSYFKVLDSLAGELKGNQGHDRAVNSQEK